MGGLIRSASLAGFAEVARANGLDPARMLREFKLPPRCLRDRETSVPAQNVRRMLEAAAERSRIECFGLIMAHTRRMSDMGPLGLLVREQPTLRLALEVCAYHANRQNEALHLTIEESGNLVVLREQLLFGHIGSVRQSTELAIGVMFRILRYFLGEQWQPRRVCFAHDPPRDLSLHRRMFGNRLEFNAEFNGIVCSRRDLDVSNPNADPGVARLAAQLLDADHRRSAADCSSQVRDLVLRLLDGGSCNVETVAQHLGVDRRTMHRRLQAERTTFSAIYGDIQMELANRYLGEAGQPLSEIAIRLGFATPSGFSRWYRQHFGHAPSVGHPRSLRRLAPSRL